MKVMFLGANHQVTGSRTLVEWLPNRYFMIDYGMEQGENNYVMMQNPVSASQIEYVFLTHAHIDHSGLLPLLVKEGFHGKIYSTTETENLCSIMLADSAHIQETDAAYQTKKNLRTGGEEVVPLYTLSDVEKTMELFRPCEYGKLIMVDEGLSVRFTDAGHLLGSSFIEFFLEENNEKRIFVCSGDVGNLNQPIIRDPKPVSEADYLLLESTYGGRLHDHISEPIPILTEILQRTFSRGGSVIIPSFAVGRTQELLYFFREIKQNNLLPEFSDFPVYVDSPLANEATAVFLQCSTDCLDEDTLKIMKKGVNPIWFDGLYTTVSSEESKALNTLEGYKVIIASGGMCEGGRIRHHLKHNLWNDKNTILFTGYQAAGTLGRLIYDGVKKVKVLGEEIDVNAEVFLLAGISGHADQDGLIAWTSGFRKKPSYIFLNHGDDDSCSALKHEIEKKLEITCFAPYSGSEFDFVSGEWIRLTDPIPRRKNELPKKTKNTYGKKNHSYDDLLFEIQALNNKIKLLEHAPEKQVKKILKEIISLNEELNQ